MNIAKAGLYATAATAIGLAVGTVIDAFANRSSTKKQQNIVE